MYIFQVVDGVCRWKTPYITMEEVASVGFPADLLFVEAPDHVKEGWTYDPSKTGDARFAMPEIPEGKIYDDETGEIVEPEEWADRLYEIQSVLQDKNNALLADFLSKHPVKFTDGKLYGVTMQDQQEIALNIQSYEMGVQLLKASLSGNDPTPEQLAAAGIVLEWHAVHEACQPWTKENLITLAGAIRASIYPAYNYNQQVKSNIFGATTKAALRDIEIDYSTLDPNYVPPTEETKKGTETA